MMSIKPPVTALALSLLAAACGQEIPDQKAFPGYAKGPEPAAQASPLVAEVPLSAEALARKTETSRLTLDRTVETMRQRLTQLKQQIVESKAGLDEPGRPPGESGAVCRAAEGRTPGQPGPRPDPHVDQPERRHGARAGLDHQ